MTVIITLLFFNKKIHFYLNSTETSIYLLPIIIIKIIKIFCKSDFKLTIFRWRKKPLSLEYRQAEVILRGQSKRRRQWGRQFTCIDQINARQKDQEVKLDLCWPQDITKAAVNCRICKYAILSCFYLFKVKFLFWQ